MKNQAHNQTANVSQNDEGKPAQILSKVMREIQAAGRLADTVLKSRDNLNGVLETLDHLSNAVLPELRQAINAPVPAITCIGQLTAHDPRGSEYGMIEVRHYSDETTGVLHSRDGYSLTMETRFFKNWAGDRLGRIVRPVTLADVAKEFNRRGMLARVESAGYPGGVDNVFVRVGHRSLSEGGTEEWGWFFGPDGGDEWTGALHHIWKDDKGEVTDDELVATMGTNVPSDCDDAAVVVDGFLAGAVTPERLANQSL